jgi:hypothetical protein
MRSIRVALLCAFLLALVPLVPAQVELPAAAKEVVKQFEDETADIDRQFDAEVKKVAEKRIVELKKLQDLFCKEAKLDEAVAVRDLIRALRAGSDPSAIPDLPAAAKEVLKQHEEEVAEVEKKAEAEVKKHRDKALTELKKLQDLFCKDAKLDEAVAVRDLIRTVRDGVTTAAADPGYINNGADDIGKVFFYEVTGVATGQSIWGTDVYTTGSHCGMAAVHCGLLKPDQKGVVKVTILPGQGSYEGSTRNSVSSFAYGPWGVSFKVERVYRFLGRMRVKPAEHPKD